MEDPLASLKEKIKIKPVIGERKMFDVVIKGVVKPKIVDETDRGFNRTAFFDRLKENKMGVVISKTRESVVKKNVVPKKQDVILIEPTDLILKLTSDELMIESDMVIVDVEPGLQVDKKRRTKPVTKGPVVLSPEFAEYFDESLLKQRMPAKSPTVLIKAPAYYLNNREIFINFINILFKPYHDEHKKNKDAISCDTIGLSNGEFSLLTHQKIVRDYMNLYTPYRGLLLYHGLGSGKTCTSIAIAEGMKDYKKVIVLTPASLRMNYMEELKKCGDLIYKKNQYWEWIGNPEMFEPIAKILNISKESVRKRRGAWFVNIKKKSNYSELTNDEKKTLDAQLNEMIDSKYTFIHYNGIRTKRLGELTNDFTTNLFDNAVVIVDEAHNLISRIVNKIKKEKDIDEDDQGEKAHAPKHLASKLYEYLLSAKNAKIVLLTGTPVINYPNEFGILFNILRGYIKTWKITLDVKTKSKVDRDSLYRMLMGEKTLDFLEYSPASSVLTITRNPFGFKNKIKKESGYKGVTNEKKDEKGVKGVDDEVLHIDNSFISDEEFISGITKILHKNDIKITKVSATNKKALPDDFDLFSGHYIDTNTNTLKNADSLKRRIIGLSSFFKSAQESLLPRYDEMPGKDYHVVEIEMSDAQFKLYEAARAEERKTEKPPSKKGGDVYKEQMSTYRIFSRLFCNYAMPERPKPAKAIVEIQTETKKVEKNLDLNNDREGEVEGDEILDAVGDVDYKVRVEQKIKEIRENPTEFLSKDALQIYSPKFLHMLENITDEANVGLHLVYSQFRTLEGVGIFSLVLEANGFTRFKIKRNQDAWELDIAEEDRLKPKYALYTGTETAEEKEIIRNIYNGDWNYVPSAIVAELTKQSPNNNLGEICKVLMITSSGSEGINLRNTRFVHIMEPYWHPVRSEQVIGRARRICSHKSLPVELQTVEVFVYLMKFSEKQLASNDAIELKRKDLSKGKPIVPITSDQYLFEISDIKSKLTKQLTTAIKESAFDCSIYSGSNCMNFADPDADKFTYVPDFRDQSSDVTTKINKVAVEWKGEIVPINGVDYVSRRMSKNLLNIYDLESYKQGNPRMVGTLEIDKDGEVKFNPIV
jgi:hypothetical protein